MSYDLLLYLHVIGATVLLGTGAGIAFFMVVSHQSRDAALIAHVSGIVVLADFLFTATAALAQPITGVLLARAAGWPLLEGWVALSLALYIFVGAFWLPVVWIQSRMHRLACKARDNGTDLPPAYSTLYRIWFACGFPAFAAVLAILWLMLFKPAM
ncbi:MAG: DUF2269 domain-containing protein [Silicimonas sp.]|nr:DUF2269 domain-containing protein [Silicimonas sp.]